MARLNPENVRRSRELMGLYPDPRSALIPMLHIAQEQDGWLTNDAMEHIGELLDLAPAEVYGTATFYDMIFTHPVGRYLVSICTNLACMLNGAYDLLHHAEDRLGVASGGTTADGEFTLEEVECIAFCGAAPCLAVNWRYFGDVTNTDFDRLIDDLRTGRLADRVPPHGTLCRVRRRVDMATVPASGQPVAPVEDEDTRLQHEEPALAAVGSAGDEDPANPRATAGGPSQARAIRVAGESSDRSDQDGEGGDDKDEDELEGGTS
ncbi:MAG TPA: NAD(P)H-dependent oxidoreductase subunit E [Acidimicrobiales bacterium]|nr:NAD(P)H-dependent oxidoreductase subunit E [Acidimicrobiales bacterium]